MFITLGMGLNRSNFSKALDLVWILETGFWDDNKYWVNAALWID